MQQKYLRNAKKDPGSSTARRTLEIQHDTKTVRAGQYSGKNVERIFIPKSVTEIQDGAFKRWRKLEEIVFETGSLLTTIGKEAFLDSTNLKKIEFPEGLREIGLCAFMNSGVESFVAPKTLRTIRQGAFARCKNLKIATLNEGLELLGTDERPAKECVNYANLRQDGMEILGVDEYPDMDEYLYRGVFQESALEHIMLPSTLRAIEYSAFYGCTKLKGINFPIGLEKIGEQCFYQTGLEEVTLNKNLKEIGNDAFYDYCNLKVIWLDNDHIFDVKHAISKQTAVLSISITIDGSTLQSLRKLADVVIPEGVEEIGDEWFKNSSIERVTIAASVKSIGEDAFCGCGKLRQVMFASGSKLTKISDGCFRMSALGTITIPSGITELGTEAFSQCQKLKTIQFQDGSCLKSIGEYCFCHSGLREVMLPPDVKKIGCGAFSNCKQLKSARLNEGLEVLGQTQLDSQRVEAGIYECSGLQVIELPSTLREIGYNTFHKCRNLREIRLPSELRRICCSAFKECSIGDISFPSVLEEIQRGAFYNNKLAEISFQDGSQLREVGEYAFGHNICAEVSFPKDAHVSEKVFDKCLFFEPGEKSVAMII